MTVLTRKRSEAATRIQCRLPDHCHHPHTNRLLLLHHQHKHDHHCIIDASCLSSYCRLPHPGTLLHQPAPQLSCRAGHIVSKQFIRTRRSDFKYISAVVGRLLPLLGGCHWPLVQPLRHWLRPPHPTLPGNDLMKIREVQGCL